MGSISVFESECEDTPCIPCSSLLRFFVSSEGPVLHIVLVQHWMGRSRRSCGGCNSCAEQPCIIWHVIPLLSLVVEKPLPSPTPPCTALLSTSLLHVALLALLAVLRTFRVTCRCTVLTLSSTSACMALWSGCLAAHWATQVGGAQRLGLTGTGTAGVPARTPACVGWLQRHAAYAVLAKCHVLLLAIVGGAPALTTSRCNPRSTIACSMWRTQTHPCWLQQPARPASCASSTDTIITVVPHTGCSSTIAPTGDWMQQREHAPWECFVCRTADCIVALSTRRTGAS